MSNNIFKAINAVAELAGWTCIMNSDGSITVTRSKADPADDKKIDPVVQVINSMNKLLKTSYKTNSKATAGIIKARLNEGYDPDDLIKVIKHKLNEWGDNPNMKNYLRPQTLFSLSKFEGYLMAAKATKTSKLFELFKGDWNE